MSLEEVARHKVREQGQYCLTKVEQALAELCQAQSVEQKQQAHEVMQDQLERFIHLQQFYAEDRVGTQTEQLRSISSLIGRGKPEKNKAEYLQHLTRFYQLLDRVH